jgi:hypothetical protein
MRRTSHVALIGTNKNVYKILAEKSEKRYISGNLDIDVRVVLKWISEYRS